MRHKIQERQSDVNEMALLNKLTRVVRSYLKNPSGNSELRSLVRVRLENFEDELGVHDNFLIDGDPESYKKDVEYILSKDPSLSINELLPTMVIFGFSAVLDNIMGDLEKTKAFRAPRLMIYFYGGDEDVTGFHYNYEAQAIELKTQYTREYFEAHFRILRNKGILEGRNMVDLALQYVDYIMSVDPRFQTSLAHELQHMVDDLYKVDFSTPTKKGKDGEIGLRPGGTTIEKGDPDDVKIAKYKKYLNDPIEMSAHFREFSYPFYNRNIDKYREIAQKLQNGQDVAQEINKLVKEFYNKLTEQNWFKYLEDDNQKSMMTRIYTFTTDIIEKLAGK